MAEGIVNYARGKEWVAFSAGTHPKPAVHPNAVRVMKEIGIDISNARTKSINEFRDAQFDLVVTVCDSAAEECPVWLGTGKRVHVGFPDPAKATGSEDEIITQFRQVRDDIKKDILSTLDTFAHEKIH
jgi:arsenate reductase